MAILELTKFTTFLKKTKTNIVAKFPKLVSKHFGKDHAYKNSLTKTMLIFHTAVDQIINHCYNNKLLHNNKQPDQSFSSEKI